MPRKAKKASFKASVITQDKILPKDLTSIPFNQLPKEGKIVSAKAMAELNFQVADIAKILGFGERSVWRYIKEEELPNNKYWQDYGNSIKKLIESKEDIMRARSLSYIDTKMENANFRDLVGFYKVASDSRREDNKVVIGVHNPTLYQFNKYSK